MSFFSLSAYKWIHGELKGNVPLQYLAWVSYPMILVMFASLFCHLVSPQAIGKLSIICHICLFPLFYLLPSVFLLHSSSILTTLLYLLHSPSFCTDPSFFPLFLLYRFWYSRAENHPERCRAEGISDPQSFRS